MLKIAITQESLFDGEERAIVRLLVRGFDRVHIRKPRSSRCEIAALLERIPRRWRSRLVLHDCLDLAVEYGLGGVNVNARSGDVPEGYDGVRCRSCHSIEEVERYKEEYDYLLLSPIFDSISKSGYKARFSREELLSAHRRGVIDSRVVALGGVNFDRIGEVSSLGFGGYAMLGAAWEELKSPPVVMSIAGSDSSGGAGIQADVKSISALGAYAATTITALTAQNTMGVSAIHPVPAAMVRQQGEAVFDDLKVEAVKIGMINDAATAAAVVDLLQRYRCENVVCDPVMVATSGARLMSEDAVAYIEQELFPLSHLLTPNLHEAQMLLRSEIHNVEQMVRAARQLHEKYRTAVLIKGGHLDGDVMCDVMYDGEISEYRSARIPTRNLHGTGCTLSSAIATYLAHGYALREAIACAKEYIARAISSSISLRIGHGHGPLWHFAQME